jgi:RHS repeat-associated protein
VTAQAGVYFDDLKVTHTQTRVLQYNEYYPFGLQTSTSWTREGHKNDFLYNSGSELNTNAQWYETMFRGYDAALGRFLQVDPHAVSYESWSPYNYAFNDPVFWNDPTGADVAFGEFLNDLYHSTSGNRHYTGDEVNDLYAAWSAGEPVNMENYGSEIKVWSNGDGSYSLTYAETYLDYSTANKTTAPMTVYNEVTKRVVPPGGLSRDVLLG